MKRILYVASEAVPFIKTGGLDSHGKNIISRCPYS